MFKRFILIFTLCCVIFIVPASAAEDYDFDDRYSDIVYSSRSVGSDQACYSGTYSSLSSSNSLFFEFDGDTLSLNFLRYRNSGSACIYIDGELVATRSFTPSASFIVTDVSYSDLGSGFHTCTVVCLDQNVTDAISGYSVAGRVYFDSYSVSEYYDLETIISLSLMIIAVGIIFTFFVDLIDLIRRFLTL